MYIDSIHSNSKEDNDIFEANISQCDTALKNYWVKLREILEEIAEFQNAKDMVCFVDMAFTEISYNLIYERKGDYDFEEDQV